jgi:NADPH:quinone reductase-like Zn-dependent oxidoreductase
VVAYPEWEGWAERIPVPVNWVAPLPDTVSFEQAATLPAAGLVADGRLRPRIGWTADWTRTADAFAAMARREFRGKAVLTVPDES